MTTSPLRPGDPRRLGDYRLLSRLGEGGMGTVFLGRDPEGGPVAVKVIRPEHASNDEFRRDAHRFAKIASTASSKKNREGRLRGEDGPRVFYLSTAVRRVLFDWPLSATAAPFNTR